ncbi:MAG: enamine deaminase RidA [Rhizobiales bacterium]|nr:enamine deaminase RidA [Hyphomicrobiales bacterium]MBA67936.1 enamine deaminase RidA [Hyphomicrobiales bacterium]|tara:strand:+ start:222 stop:632 length:411 start_codon:yes stop_codon:yes gene_type:complete
MKHHTPKTIRPPFARYSHAVEIPAGHRLLVCSGQLGLTKDDHIPEDAGEQTELCFANAAEILVSAGMDFSHVVRINAYVTDRAWLKPYMAVRDQLFGDPPPASTLMIVSGFANEAFKVEIEVLAAAPDAEVPDTEA